MIKVVEFIEKWLPDFYKKWDEWSQNEYDGSMCVDFADEYWDEAIQNFADKICQKQRENCAHSLVYDEPRGESQHRILNAEQPKTEQI